MVSVEGAVVLAIALFFLVIRIGTIAFLWLQGVRTPRIPAPSNNKPLEGHKVSIVIPAYNEEADILNCLEAIAASTTSPNVEVVVIDDKSTDRTLEIVQQMSRIDTRIRGVAGADRPADFPWRGKNWACAQGAEHATGDLLLFLDADVQLKPFAIETAAAQLQLEGIGWISLYPRIRYSCFWEAVVMPVVLIAQRLKINKANSKQVVYANGTFNIFTAATYKDLGGHRTVGDQVRESSALAELAIQRGVPFKLMQADDLASVRFYGSFAEMWHGLMKSSRFIVLSMPRFKLLLGVGGMLILSVAPIALLVYCIVHIAVYSADHDHSTKNYPATAAAGLAIICAAQTMQFGARLIASKYFAIPVQYWWLMWLANCVQVCLLLRSLTVKTVTWGGRVIPDGVIKVKTSPPVEPERSSICTM
eukprot:TRINITY_DN80501_c0_g1_i1.p1 TRINITY_DN80501_c0_g1~~TRINITY_DN80501_c0_g1_i1.p1  ORF type:complete len:419 (+),score=57.06 TRINITY_DN80501_c0_g1_i1:27-1283(+)